MPTNKLLDLLPPEAIAVLTEFQSNQTEDFSELFAAAKSLTGDRLLEMSQGEFEALAYDAVLSDWYPYHQLWDMQDDDEDT